jgi:hypothetical protein
MPHFSLAPDRSAAPSLPGRPVGCGGARAQIRPVPGSPAAASTVAEEERKGGPHRLARGRRRPRRTASTGAAADERPCGRTAGRVGASGWGTRGRVTGVGLPVDFLFAEHASIGGTGRLRLFPIRFPVTHCRPFYGIPRRETDGGEYPVPRCG